jgi:dTMP kinase
MPGHGQSRFVVIEGLDGAGTTTQAAMTASALESRGIGVCLTAEPSDGPLGRVARAHVRGEITLDPPATALAFLADRADHLARVVRPALAEGRWVVCDRYLLSTLAYQGAEGVDKLWVLDASGLIERPDLTVYLDVTDDERRRRIATRPSADRYEAPGYDQRLRRSYGEAIELLRARGHVIAEIDGTRPAGEVSAAVTAELDALV